MTVDAATPLATFTIAGAGPYPLGWPYEESSLSLRILQGGQWFGLTAAEYTVSPTSSADTGFVTLAPATAEAFAGAALTITRATAIEQGWTPRPNTREVAIAAQLDRMIEIDQEAAAQVERSLRLTGQPIPPAQVLDGHAVMWSDAAGFIPGPSAADIAGVADLAAALAMNAAGAVGERDYPWIGDGLRTPYVLPAVPASPEALSVYIDGVRQLRGTYTLSGATITPVQPWQLGAQIVFTIKTIRAEQTATPLLTFAARADLVTWAASHTPTTGARADAGGFSYLFIGTGTAISDLAGWVPYEPHLSHWGADKTGAVTCSALFKQAINYLASLGGGKLDTSGGVWRCDTTVNVDVGQDNIRIIGNGRILKGANTGAVLLKVLGANFKMDGPTLDGQKSINTVDTTLLFVYGPDAKITSTRFTGSPKNGLAGAYDGTSALTTTSLSAIGCTFDNNDGVGWSNAGVVGLTSIGNTFKQNGLEGMTLDQGTSNAKVTGNHFELNNRGSLEGAFGIGQIGYDALNVAAIVGNTFVGDSARSGVRMGNATGTSKGVVIADNVFDGHSIAIDLSGTTSTTAGDTATMIMGNSAQNCTTMIAYDGRSTVKIGPNSPGNGVTNYINALAVVPGTYLTEQPPWTAITGKPTTVADYAIADAVTLTGVQALTNKTIVAGSNTITGLDLTYMAQAGFKQICRMAATVNIDVTTGGLITVDGVLAIAGDRVLLPWQTTTSENGIYIAAAGSWTRATDADASVELWGAIVPISRGTVNGGTQWATAFKSPNVLGTDPMVWNKIVTAGGVFPWGSLTGKPTTVATSGLTDAQTTIGSAKLNCRLLAATNVDLTTGGLITVDGVVTTAGMRILCTAQTAPAENGIYVASAGSWTRAFDADLIDELYSAYVTIDRGTYGGTRWTTTCKYNDVLGTTAIKWFRIMETGGASFLGSVAPGALTLNAYGSVSLTPNATGTFTTTPLAAGVIATLIINTAGTTPWTLTFGTGFKTTSTLVTGSVAAKTFTMMFVSDGTAMIEIPSRTAM